MTNLNQLFSNLGQFSLNDHNMQEAIQACVKHLKMDASKVAENPFIVIQMYQAMGVVHMAQGQQAILAEMKEIRNELKAIHDAIEASGAKISEEIDEINFN